MNMALEVRSLVIIGTALLLSGYVEHVVAETDAELVDRLNRSYSQAIDIEKRGDKTKAIEVYERGYQEAKSSDQPKLAAKYAFKRARTAQLEAEHEQNERQQREKALATAEQYYEYALEYKPGERAIYNNMALLYFNLGQLEKAETYFRKATAASKDKKVLVKPASEKTIIIPAKYQTLTKTIVTKPASERIEIIPAMYEPRTKRVLVRSASYTWVRGPCADGVESRLDADGVPRCKKLERPAEYKTVSESVLVQPASERKVVIPAEYRTIKETVQVKEEQKRVIKTPAEYKTLAKQFEEDKNNSLYQENLAQLLAKQGKWSEAEKIYQQIALRNPQGNKYHKLLMDRYSENVDHLTPYLSMLVDAEQVRRVQHTVLDLLESNKGSRLQRKEWLILFAAALAKEKFDPAGFAASDRGERLVNLVQTDNQLAGATRQLQRLFAGNDWRRQSYRFWQEGSPFREPSAGVWARDAFRGLARTMAAWYGYTGKFDSAERCLAMAITFAPDEIDPAAISDLADLYIDQGEVGKVHKLLDKYQVKMFEGKGRAYRESLHYKIFEYHALLGKIYAFAGDSEKYGVKASAIFQLGHAREAARQIERKSPNDNGEPLFTADLARLLAKEYEEDSKAEAANDVRAETANRYLQFGDSQTAAHLLRPLKDQDSQVYQDRYPDLAPLIDQWAN